jgi:hypothetical protein
MNELKDWRGHTIAVGTPVAYAVLDGFGLKEGIVTEVGQRYVIVRNVGSSWGEKNKTDRLIRLTNLERVVVLPRTNHEAPHHG